LNWALVGLYELRQQGRFIVPSTCQEDADKLRSDSNPARVFLHEHYSAGQQGFLTTAQVYQSYRDWCQANGYFPLADRGFGREVARCFPTVERKQKVIDGIRGWAYCGLERAPNAPNAP
jgi:putative DNA primase/helicase